jgi:hypothetical protein
MMKEELMMKKHFWLLAVLVLMMQVLWAGVTAAAETSDSYNSEGDITISITIAEDELQTSDSTGEVTFETQEEAHNLLADETGQEVEHSYVWFEVNGQKVLAVDPPCAYFPE